ncbi:MAG: endolytic transglycosylase MltG, partial [Pseudomonadota bacterium]|nr:endolytic transglycosylase MltG [Pseudomonadota bacterium]
MRLFMKLVLSLIVVLVIASAITWDQYQKFITMPLKIPEQGYVYTVTSGSNLQQISRDLYDAELTSLPAEYLRIYGRLTHKAHLIKAGEYRIEPQTTLPQLLNLLISGEVIQYAFTIVEGITAQQLIDMVANDERFTKTLTDTSLPAVMTALE